MTISGIPKLAAGAVALSLFFSASDLQASSKVKVKGNLETVAEQVDEAFDELDITSADAEVHKDWAQAVGKAKSGARVTVAINTTGEDECEISVSSESPEDPEIEERFLRMMQTR